MAVILLLELDNAYYSISVCSNFKSVGEQDFGVVLNQFKMATKIDRSDRN